MRSEHSDEQLVALSCAGDLDSYGELVRRYQVIVLSFLTRLTGQRSLAEDLTQESFIRGFSKLNTYHNSGQFRSWICAIAYRQFLMAHRKHRKDPEFNGPDFFAELPDLQCDQTVPLDLERAMMQLSPVERQMIVLSYSAGFSHTDISQMSGMPAGTVKSHINRGRSKLQQLLGGIHNE